MSSPFLDASQLDTSILEDGSIAFFGATLGAINLQPTFPVKVNEDQQFYSTQLEISDVNDLENRLDSIITNPFPGTLQVQNLTTAYDTTPVNLNVFIATALSDLSDLNSATQYITATLGDTNIASNISTNDVNASAYRNQIASTFIDMTSATDISINATNLDFNGNPILTNPLTANLDVANNYINNSFGIQLSDNVSIIPTPPTGSLTLYNDTEVLYTIDSSDIVRQIAYTDSIGAFLPLDGSLAMTGDLDMGTKNITNTGDIVPSMDNTQDIGTFLDSYKDIYLGGSIQGSSKTSNVNQIVTGPASAANNNLAAYDLTTGKLIKDSGISTTSVTGGPFLPLAGGTMSGAINMGTQEINNLSAIRTTTDQIVIGNGITFSGNTCQLIGDNITANALSSVIIGSNASCTSGFENVIIGRLASNNVGNACVIIGKGASVTGTGDDNIVIGRDSTSSSQQTTIVGQSSSITGNNGGIIIGFTNVSSASGANIFGTGLTNSTAGSLLIQASSNIRPDTNNSCDLGISTNQFKDVYALGIVKTPSVDPNTAVGLTIGGTNATSLNLGRAAITSTIQGTAVATVASGAWYSTASFSNAFTATVNRLVNPALSNSALLSQFTNTLGVLTYTGTRTRTFKIDYCITYTNPANNGMTMTFFNSKNGSTVLGTSQTSIRQQGYTATVGATAQTIHVTFSDIVSLATNDTIQLAGACSLSVNVAFPLVSCNVVGLLN